MRFLIPFLLVACAKKPNVNPTKVTASQKTCLADKALCHDTAWLFWKGHLKPVTDNTTEGWDSSTRTGQLSPKWLFGVKSSGVAVFQGKDTPWVPVLSYTAELSGIQIAQKTFAELCDAGHDTSCVSQGYMLLDKDKEKATALFQGACSEKTGVGCQPLAQLQQSESDKALASLQMGALRKDPNSTAGAAFALQKRDDAGQKKDKIHELLQQSCLSTQKPQVFMGGDGLEVQVGRWQFFGEQAKACFALGESSEDAATSKKLISKSCAMEYTTACEKLCNDGEGEACFDLAVLHHKGAGVAPSAENGKKFFQKSCELGYKPGCTMVK